MVMHTNWRDCKEWNDSDLHLSTTSNEAAKLYDATLSQYVGWYEEDSVGGIEKCVSNMLAADPNFVMGHVISTGLDVMGTGRPVDLDPEFRASIDNMVALADKLEVSKREKMHVKAVSLYADGYMADAYQMWEDILVLHPTDMLALKLAWDACFFMGYQTQMRDVVARVFPYWKADMPLYSYLHGLYAFGLVETNFYDQSERVARKGLELNPRDAGSTHSLAHVLEMMGRQNEGIGFMSSTVDDWTKCGMLACHNFWHWAVYHIEKGEYQGALDIFDTQVGVRVKSGAMFDIMDACSLLYRLEMEGFSVEGRWDDIYEIGRPHMDDHLLAFNDAHILMSCLGAKQKESTDKLIDSVKGFVRDGKGTNHELTKKVGLPLCEAFVAYDNGDFAEATDLVAPLKYDLQWIGGSNAQRDVFNQFIIHCALKSPEKRHSKLAKQLLLERKALKEHAPLTDRLIARYTLEHAD